METRLSLYILLTYFLNTHGQVPRPRGVALSKASFYQSGVEFTCLDGSLTIGFDKVNDDYCDCRDGSDEPGTAACPNGSFHCTNAGYRPMNIPSSRADDGICDCPDGSDEYSGKVTCVNICKELARQLREEREQYKALASQGHEIYKEYVEKGNAAKEENQGKIENLRNEHERLKSSQEELEAIKKEAEEKEKEAKDRHREAWEAEKEKLRAADEAKRAQSVFTELDEGGDGQVSVTDLQRHAAFDIDKNGEVSYEEAREYLEDNEAVDFALFMEKIWENIKGVYSGVVEEKTETTETDTAPAEADTPPETTPPPFDIDAAIQNPDEDIDIDDVEDHGHYDDDDDRYDDEDDERYDDEHYDDEDDFPSRHYPRGDDADGYDDKKSPEDEEYPMPEYDEETKKLIEAADVARDNYNDINRQYTDVDRQLTETDKLLNLNLGPNNEYYPLRGQCFKYTDREYTYELCPFEKTSQSNKNGGSHTSLGRWSRWDGPANNPYGVMLFEKGQGCWNGPDRMTRVVVSCGIKDELTSASEPSRCEYEFKFSSPAACSTPPAAVPSDLEHDEL